MGERKVRLADVARATGINRGTLSRLYQEDAARIDLEVLEGLCAYFRCGIDSLLEYHPSDDKTQAYTPPERSGSPAR